MNHLVTVQSSVSQSDPWAVREPYRPLSESKRPAGLPAAGAVDANPFGVAANRRNLEPAIKRVHRQGLIRRRYTVDELFDDTTRGLGA